MNRENSVARWTESKIDELKAELNRRHLLDPLWVSCADALGSLQFDLADAKKRGNAMTSDYQRGASAGREMAADFVLGDARAASLERVKLYEAILALPLPADPASSGGAVTPVKLPFERLPQHATDPGFGDVPPKSGAVSLHPQNPASSEGADKNLEGHLDHIVALVKDDFRSEALAVLSANEQRVSTKRDVELATARGNLLLLEETCRYSLGLAGDLIGDALTKAVGDKVIAMRDEAATLRGALEKIAKDEKVLRGYGDFDEGPMSGDVCQSIAREALVTRWLLFGGGLPEVAKLEIPPRDEELAREALAPLLNPEPHLFQVEFSDAHSMTKETLLKAVATACAKARAEGEAAVREYYVR